MIRRYTPEDSRQVAQFSCYDNGSKWTKTAQDIIRSYPDVLSDLEQKPVAHPSAALSVFVAVKESSEKIVGVVGFGPPTDSWIVTKSPVTEVYSLGVDTGFRQIRIGTDLKKLVRSEVASWGRKRAIVSRVHKRNYKMIGLNKKLNFAQDEVPTDEMFWFAQIVRPPLTMRLSFTASKDRNSN